MLEQHRGVAEALPPATARAVARELGLPYYPGALYEGLEAAGVYQCDLVVALLRVNTPEALSAAEAIVGRRIERCPPGLRRLPERVTLAEGIERVLRTIGLTGGSGGDNRRFVRVEPNLQLPTTDSWGRYRIIKVGMTVGQFLARGGSRRDVREWAAAGKVSLSPA